MGRASATVQQERAQRVRAPWVTLAQVCWALAVAAWLNYAFVLALAEDLPNRWLSLALVAGVLLLTAGIGHQRSLAFWGAALAFGGSAVGAWHVYETWLVEGTHPFGRALLACWFVVFHGVAIVASLVAARTRSGG